MQHTRSFSNNRFLVIAFIVCIAGFLIVYRQLADQYHKSNLVTHSYIIKATLNQFLLNLTEAETNQRSYLIANEQESLSNYQIAIQKARFLLIILDSLTIDNSVQQDHLTRLMSGLNNSRLALQASVLTPETGHAFVSSPDILDNTRQLLNNLRIVTYSMLQAEDALLQKRVSDRNGIMRTDAYITFLIFLFVMVFSVWAYRKLRKEIILRIDSEHVSKLDSNKIELVKNDFPVREAIEESLEQIKLLSRHHSIRVEGQLDCTIRANKEWIEQVITNFLSNAIKYSPPDSEIVIRSSLKATCLKISVTDSGIGIPAEKIPFVFDRFFRVERTSDKFSGLGLGLYISSEIINHHQGQIGVISEVGNGSAFWFILPLNPQ